MKKIEEQRCRVVPLRVVVVVILGILLYYIVVLCITL